MLKRSLMLLLGTGLLARGASAQIKVTAATDWADSSAAKLVSRFHDSPAGLVSIMRQEKKSQPLAKISELADSLTGIVRSRASEGRLRWVQALYALGDAGRKRSDGFAGQPAPGVLDRLIRIDREADPSSNLRDPTLRFMLEMPEHRQAVAYVLGVATSNTLGAFYAMSHLIREIDPASNRYKEETPVEIAETTKLLRDLYTKARASDVPGGTLMEHPQPSKVIPNRDAALILTAFANQHRWKQ